MNNSTRNLKMKKLLIASTALVATAGMASADITISGHAAAGIYSGLSNKDAAAYKMTAAVGKASVAANHTVVGDEATYKTNVLKAKAALAAAHYCTASAGSSTKTAAES